ncbi:sterol 14-demethylase [Saccharomonospora amisosensis]|uniref:Sterol 14-demethylase n=1 Tax=Saccharomonospora amisosensis TaxID=1128677 RepID=A0A7X5US08_9PSEU|nr:cytochrome P450 [Saccharomonospora amisosensis]NIJ13050.1 sterol 14-demethylase [Saccharomonospora amisosensis]
MTEAARIGELRTPPMVRGLPLLGSFLEWRRDHLGVFLRAYQRHGPVFGIRLGPQKGVVLVGPKYHEFYFREVDRTLSVPELYRFVVPMFGDVMMAATDTDRRRRHVALLQSAFQGGRLAGYTEVMAEEVDVWLAGLGDSGEFELWDTFEPLVMRIAAAALMGPEIRAKVEQFRPLLVDLARGMEFILPPNLPLPKFYRRDRARRLLTEMLRPVLARRRRHPDRYDDFLQTLVDDAELRAEGDDVQVGMALCTIFTGYITTAAQACWTLVQLLRHPDYLRSVVDELDAGTTACPRAGVRPAPRLDWATKESVRLNPVMSHYARTTAKEYVVDGYRIPRGWLTMLCPGVAHRLPEVFTDPDRYDPERFSPQRAEDKRNPNALIGFSGGFYRCPGQAFGTSEIGILLAGLITRYELTPLPEDVPADFDLGVTKPKSPLRIRYRRR